MMNDEQLVKKCLEKDQLAQKQLFDTYAGLMKGICLRYANNSEEADDMMQMGFIKVFEKLAMYSGTGSLKSWIARIMVNTALDHIRKNKKYSDDIGLDKVDFQIHNQDVNAYEHLKAQDLLSVIQTLPVGFRTVFNLYAIEGYSHKEIGEQLGISENTSKSQYSRARAHLKKILEELNVVT